MVQDILVSGDLVEVIHMTTRYRKRIPIGARGVVTRFSGNSVGVKLDGYTNTASQYGIFWFTESDLRLVEEEEEKEETMAKGLKGYKKVAGIEIGCGKYYYALYDDDIKEGDKVLVSGTAAGKILLVDSIMDVDEDTKFDFEIISEVICKVDTSAFEKRVADRKRAAELITMMDKKIKEMDEVNKYAIYAQQNPELADMLNEFKQLNGLN